MDTDPADEWAQKRDGLATARNTVDRLERDLTAARVRLAQAEDDEAEAWRKLDDARRQIKTTDGNGR